MNIAKEKRKRISHHAASSSAFLGLLDGEAPLNKHILQVFHYIFANLQELPSILLDFSGVPLKFVHCSGLKD